MNQATTPATGSTATVNVKDAGTVGAGGSAGPTAGIFRCDPALTMGTSCESMKTSLGATLTILEQAYWKYVFTANVSGTTIAAVKRDLEKMLFNLKVEVARFNGTNTLESGTFVKDFLTKTAQILAKDSCFARTVLFGRDLVILADLLKRTTTERDVFRKDEYVSDLKKLVRGVSADKAGILGVLISKLHRLLVTRYLGNHVEPVTGPSGISVKTSNSSTGSSTSVGASSIVHGVDGNEFAIQTTLRVYTVVIRKLMGKIDREQMTESPSVIGLAESSLTAFDLPDEPRLETIAESFQILRKALFLPSHSTTPSVCKAETVASHQIVPTLSHPPHLKGYFPSLNRTVDTDSANALFGAVQLHPQDWPSEAPLYCLRDGNELHDDDLRDVLMVIDDSEDRSDSLRKSLLANILLTKKVKQHSKGRLKDPARLVLDPYSTSDMKTLSAYLDSDADPTFRFLKCPILMLLDSSVVRIGNVSDIGNTRHLENVLGILQGSVVLGGKQTYSTLYSKYVETFFVVGHYLEDEKLKNASLKLISRILLSQQPRQKTVQFLNLRPEEDDDLARARGDDDDDVTRQLVATLMNEDAETIQNTVRRHWSVVDKAIVETVTKLTPVNTEFPMCHLIYNGRYLLAKRNEAEFAREDKLLSKIVTAATNAGRALIAQLKDGRDGKELSIKLDPHQLEKLQICLEIVERYCDCMQQSGTSKAQARGSQEEMLQQHEMRDAIQGSFGRMLSSLVDMLPGIEQQEISQWDKQRIARTWRHLVQCVV